MNRPSLLRATSTTLVLLFAPLGLSQPPRVLPLDEPTFRSEDTSTQSPSIGSSSRPEGTRRSVLRSAHLPSPPPSVLCSIAPSS
jgi:hypothetical protein